MGVVISWITKNSSPGAGDPNQGAAREDDNQPQSLSGMISTLVPVLILSLVYLLIFLILRFSQRRFYAPRTYLGSLRENERSPELPKGMFGWVGAFWKIPDVYALQHQSLDAYLFLRYLRICTTICFVCLCITWPVLFPVNATGGNGKKQLELLSYSNINIDKNAYRLFAHALVGWVVYGFIMYMIMRECIFFINIRQAYLLTPQYARRISSRTVIFTAVPEDYLDPIRLRQIFGNDTVKNIWIAGETKEIEKMVEERDKIAMKLEKGEIKLLKTVNKERIKSAKKSGAQADVERDTEHGNVSSRWITTKMRPTHRTGPLGLIGKKVDTIEWGRSELNSLIPKVEHAQANFKAGNYKKFSTVFIEFHASSDAQAAYQVVTHHQALRMSPKYIGVKPEEVVWKNLNMSWWQKLLRRYAVYLAIALLIIFWAIPVGIVGVVAQVNTFKNLPGLTWIGKIPSVILGVVSGLLPSVALSILMSLVPVIMRSLAKTSGEVSLSRVELFTQNAYFAFQLIQVFLIRTLTDTASTALVQIAKNPGSVFSILAEAIPTSSNFYISYFIVQGLTIAVGVLTQVVGFVIFNLFYKFLTSTPRAMFKKWTTLSAILWGSLMPVYSGIAVISITYAVVAPIMLFWATLGLALFYLAYRYNVLFVSESKVDTHGLFYPRALKHLFAGVYLALICMVGLFAVSKAPGPAVLMGVFLVFTIMFHISLNNALDPLMYNLPRTLQVEEEIMQSHGGIAHDPATSNESNGKPNFLNNMVPGTASGVQKKGNFLFKFLKPWIYADYQTLRAMMPNEESGGVYQEYSDEIEADAYWHPAVASPTPILWIPEDPLGVSKEECALTGKVIPISDEGATLNEKNKVEWDTESARPPIWTEKIYY